ncbi:MAG: VTT domain-containing protein [Verrucomicrobiae bacterium]|nr:VTT domain-containing protein [Verrucomicrobiae bacterium]MCP5539447.1 VTT domain-containing protein [Akkermansiaceae bacterium]
MRLFWLFLVLALAVLIPFAIWGDFFETLFSSEGAAAWLSDFGPWAWAAGIGLLVADLFLPVPGTAVIAALGYVYGVWVGGLLGAAGSILSGLLAYGLCRKLGHRAAEWIAGREDLKKGEHLFGGAAGGFIVALSRWLPVMPEVVACLAGLARMPFGRFTVALCCGGLPLGFAFAAVGAAGRANPGVAIALSAALPPVLWSIARPLLNRHRRRAAETAHGSRVDPER